ncbi:MAG: ankyrin repeat domain-containing protein, partial [Pseudomonadota bacterium]
MRFVQSAAVHAALAALGLAAGVFSASVLAAEAPAFLTADADNSAAMAADVNARQPDGSTALQWAVYRDDLAEVQRLLRAGADVSLANNFGATPLSLAAEAGNAALIRVLLKAGARADAANAEGQTALMAVARTGNVDAARLLLQAGAEVNAREHWGGQTALMWAASQQHPEMIRTLLRAGAKVNERSNVTDWARKVTAEPREKGMDRGGFTPLLYAAREGCVACLKPLLDGGADINLPDPRGTTPLILALMNLAFDTAKQLIDSGADIQTWDFVGQTPLYAALDVNTIPRGARPDVASTDTTTAMDIVQMLLARGANVNAQLKLRMPARSYPGDRNADFRVLTTGATPLMRAAVAADLPAIEVLLKAGALVDLPIADGTTPLFGAILPAAARARFKTEEQAIAAMRLLRAAGADPRKAVGQSTRVLHLIHIHTPNHARVPGSTALMMAVVQGWKDAVRELVSYGVDIDAKDEDGLTALDYALGRERYGFLQVKPTPMDDMADLLRELGAKVENPQQPPWPPLSTPQITARVPE